jgi:5-carboxymethyl-2-hydroxymuconate isomerase
VPGVGGRAVDDDFARTARKDGRQVATLRRLALGNQFIVESDVYPVGTMRVEPMRPGPYVFATREEASAFIEETTLALEYLGCEIS